MRARAMAGSLFSRVVCGGVALCGVSVQAARPMLTDDARVVDPGSCQVETWVQRSRSSPERWLLPACSGGSGSEWTLGAQVLEQGQPAASAALLFQHKRLLRSTAPGQWGWAMAVGATASPSAAGRSSTRTLYVNLPWTLVSADEKTLLHLNVGALQSRQGSVVDGSQNVAWQTTGGVAVERQWADRWWVIAESSWPGRNRQQLQLGMRYWWVPDRLQVDTTWGRTQQGQTFGSVGLRWLFEP